MSLKTWNGEEWIKSPLWRRYNTSKAILVCGGPSMNSIDLSKLRGPGKTIIGLNNTYPKVYPDIWICADDPHCYNRHVFYEPFMKILRGGYNNRKVEGHSIYTLPNVHYFDHDKCKYVDLLDRVGKDTSKFVWHFDVFTVTINILLWMGFKELYLVGCDLSTEKGDYHHGQKLSEKNREYNSSLYDKLYGYLSWLNNNRFRFGLNIYSMSPLSRINEKFEYVSIEDLNASILETLPPLGPLYHTNECDVKTN